MFSEGLKSDLQLKTGYINNSVKVLSSQVLAMSKNKNCVYCLGSLFYHLTIPMWKEFLFLSRQNLFCFKICAFPLISLPCTNPLSSYQGVGKNYVILANLLIGYRKAAAGSSSQCHLFAKPRSLLSLQQAGAAAPSALEALC